MSSRQREWCKPQGRGGTSGAGSDGRGRPGCPGSLGIFQAVAHKVPSAKESPFYRKSCFIYRGAMIGILFGFWPVHALFFLHAQPGFTILV